MIDKTLNIDSDPLGTIASLTPSADLIDVLLPTGVMWQFRPITSAPERRAISDKIGKFADAIREKKGSIYTSLKNKKVAIPEDEEDVRAAYELHLRAANPPLPIDVVFKLIGAPETFVYIVAALESADKTFRSVLYQKAREELKGKSNPTPDTESD